MNASAAQKGEKEEEEKKKRREKYCKPQQWVSKLLPSHRCSDISNTKTHEKNKKKKKLNVI